MASKKGDLDVTSEELDRIKKAFKNEEFRKLFAEYAEELADPENRKRYEDEIRQLEREKGMDVNFVNPDPGYVIKTSDGETKVFINVCKSDQIQKPTSKRQVNPDGSAGLMWSIPHSFSPVREDLDKNGTKCKVFDVVFHPDTYRLAETNVKFKGIVHDTAFEGIEQRFSVKIDKKNFKTLVNMKYKGHPTATVIRNKVSEPKEKDPNDILNDFPYPYDYTTTEEKTTLQENDLKVAAEEKSKKDAKTTLLKDKTNAAIDATEPKYKITHRTNLEMQDFTNAPDVRNHTRPTELVVAIDLPLIKAASNVNLDIFEKQLVLTSEKPAKYHLKVDLPYSVDENQGSAKFDKTKRKLTITLPVIGEVALKPPNAVNGGGDCDEKPKENGIHQENEEVNGVHEESIEDVDSHDISHKPLIEVLSSVATDDAEGHRDTKATTNDNITGNVGTEDPVKVTHSSKDIWSESDFGQISMEKVTYLEPAYEFFQDNKTVTFILQCKRVNKNTVSKMFPSSETSGCHVTFASVGSGGFPVHYSFMAQFPSECKVDVEKTEVDVSRDNVVLLVSKAKDSRGIWSGFSAGRDIKCLQEKLFLTEYAIKADLEDLESDAMPSANHPSPALEVTDMNDNKLTIEIKDKGDTSPPVTRFSESSDDIEIVFSEERPKLHGILKQRSRTMSESSEEPLSASYGREAFTYSRENSVSAYGSESAISECDECENSPKKSVSFNSHVDRTMYKSGATVSALHNTLRCKKKRQKKREQRLVGQEQRRRRRTASGGSVSDSISDQEDTSSAPEELETGYSDDANAAALKVNESEMKKTNQAVADPGSQSNSENEVQPNAPKGKKNKSKRNKKNKDKRSVIATSAHQPPETSNGVDLKGEELLTDESGSVSGGELLATSDSDMLSPQPSSDHEPLVVANKKPAVVLVPSTDADSDDEPVVTGAKDSGLGSEPPSEKPPIQELQACDNPSPPEGLDERTSTIPESDPLKSVPPKSAPPNKPDTILDWDEGPKLPQELQPKCAFEFQNSLIYELDDD